MQTANQQPDSSCSEEGSGQHFATLAETVGLPESITPFPLHRNFSIRLQERVIRGRSTLAEHYKSFREAEIRDAAQVDQLLAAMVNLHDTEIPTRVIGPIMQLSEESYARYLDLAAALLEWTDSFLEAFYVQLEEFSKEDQRLLENFESLEGERHRQKKDCFRKDLFTTQEYAMTAESRIFEWFNNQIRQWNHAIGYWKLIPEVAQFNENFLKGTVGGAIQGDFFTPSNTAERVGQAVGQTAISFTPYGSAADGPDFAAVMRQASTEGFNWGSVEGIVVALSTSFWFLEMLPRYLEEKQLAEEL